MRAAINNWIEKRRRVRQRWQHDARASLQSYARHAYYEAQRRASRACASHDPTDF